MRPETELNSRSLDGPLTGGLTSRIIYNKTTDAWLERFHRLALTWPMPAGINEVEDALLDLTFWARFYRKPRLKTYIRGKVAS